MEMEQLLRSYYTLVKITIKPLHKHYEKNILIALSAILLCANAFAGDFELTSGRSAWRSALKQRASLYVYIDWSKCEYDNEEPVNEYFEEEDYEEVTDKALEAFIEKFNDESKRLKAVEEQSGAEYKMVIKMTNIDSFMSVMNFTLPGFKGKIWGSVEVIEVSSGNTIMAAEFDEIKGGRDFVKNDCFAKAFKDLAKELTDF